MEESAEGPERSESMARRIREHERLLTMARKAQAAADDRDWRRFAFEIRRLRAELALHCEGEGAELDLLPAAQRAAVEAGQKELLDLVESLASMDREVPGTSLAIPTRRFLAGLTYQRDRERRALAGAGDAHS